MVRAAIAIDDVTSFNNIPLTIMEPIAMVEAKSKLDILLKLLFPDMRVSRIMAIKIIIVASAIAAIFSKEIPKKSTISFVFIE